VASARAKGRRIGKPSPTLRPEDWGIWELPHCGCPGLPAGGCPVRPAVHESSVFAISGRREREREMFIDRPLGRDAWFESM
jgi:hypothetical protein